MPKAANIKPTHKALKKYYAALQSYRDHQVTHEGALETAFQRLLEETGKSHGWRLVPKQKLKVGKHTIFPDGTLRDFFDIRCGFIDQYQVSEDKRSGIKSDPNRPDEEQYIVRLVGQVVRVSLETVRIVQTLPEKYVQ